MTTGAQTDEPLGGTVTIVTGASSGMGVAFAERFSEAGSRILLAARRAERLEALAGRINEAGGEALAFPADVTDPAQVEAMVDAARREFGRIDVLINNAGSALDRPLVETSVEEIDLQIDVNLKAVCYGTRAVLPQMIEQKSGSIINIGSICSVRHYPNYAAYVAAKFAVLGFSRSVYEEVREHGIRVNCLCPAAVNTEWADVAGAELPWPREERIQPEDMAELAMLCVTMPKRVQLEQILLWPTCESTA